MSVIKKLPIGTFVNMATVVIGGLIGLSIANVIPESLDQIISQAIGLGVLIIGFQMAFKLPESFLLVFILSLIFGGITGHLLRVDTLILDFADLFKNLVATNDSAFAKGLSTAFILFCVGSLTILGALEEGIQGKRNLLLVKSGLDGISAIIFTAKLGIGVIFSIFPMLLFQGGITMLARHLKKLMHETDMLLLSAVGGTLIVAIGINILELATIQIENLLPALLFLFPLSRLWIKYGPKI